MLLVGNYAPDRQNSMVRYAEMLRREMAARGHDVTLLTPPAVFGRLVKRGGFAKWIGYIDKYLLFPPLLWIKSRGMQVAHVCDHSNSMYLPWLPKAHRSITCHDVLAILSAEGRFPGRTISSTGRMQQRWIKKHLLAAERVACVSSATAHELQQMGATGRSVVIFNPLHTRFAPASEDAIAFVKQKVGLAQDDSYFIHVGSNAWYKNRPAVIQIFAALRQYKAFSSLRLVMVGEPMTEEMRVLVWQTNLEQFVVETTNLSDTNLNALYSGAEALLFPSLHEGFGWPVLEAQNCNCLVVTSHREPMIEVSGGAAILIDPLDPEAAAETIQRQWPERETIRTAACANTARFEMQTIMSQFERFFQKES